MNKKELEKTIKISDDKEIKVSRWFEISIFHKDNLRYQSNYIPEYLGMLHNLDAMCWEMEVLNIDIAGSILDAIKIKYFPKWLLKKFPAKIKNINTSFLYPQVNKNPDKVNLKDFNNSQKYLHSEIKTKICGVKIK